MSFVFSNPDASGSARFAAALPCVQFTMEGLPKMAQKNPNLNPAQIGAQFAPIARRAPSPKLSRSGMTGFLRAAFPACTAQHVAHLTGISASTVSNWLRETSIPSADHLAVLFTVFGQPFLTACYPVAAPWVEGQGQHERFQSAITELHAAIANLPNGQNELAEPAV